MSVYRFNLERLPGWAVAFLEEEHLPMEFTVEELTPHQRFSVDLLASLLKLEQQGLIEVRYESGRGVVVRATPPGKRLYGQV